MKEGLKHPAFVAFLVLAALFSLFTYSHEAIKMALYRNFGDFGNYYFFSKAMRLHYDIYALSEAAKAELTAQFGMPEFVSAYTGHSPGFFLFFQGLTFLKYHTAVLVWFFLNNLFLAASVLIILKLVFEKIANCDRAFVGLSAVFLVFSFQPLLENMALGQINLLILLFFAGCLYFLNEKRFILAGILLGLGVVIKPHLGILLFFFLWKGCWRTFFAALISFSFLEVVPALLYGPHLALGYYGIVYQFFAMYARDVSMFNLSLGALINRLMDASTHQGLFLFAAIIKYSISLGLLFFLARTTKGKFRSLDTKFILGFSLAIAFILIAFSVTHEHHYLFLYIPIIFLWALLTKQAKSGPALWFMVSFLLIALKYSLQGFPAFSAGWLAVYSGMKLYGVIILFFLLAYSIAADPGKGAS